MKPIKLPDPSFESKGMSDIFGGGIYSVIRRAVIIGNGSPGAENQCIGLVRALGFSDKHYALYRVIRPSGGLNEWLRWLPVSLHKRVDYMLKLLFGDIPSKVTLARNPFLSQNGQYIGLSSVLEADAKQIAAQAQESFDREGPLLVVASGRDTITLASSVRRLASNFVFVVQIQHPRYQLNRFDLVITPKHDYYALTADGRKAIPSLLQRWITPYEPPDDHVVLTLGALHQADAAALRAAAAVWHDELAPLPKPLLVVNVGGPNRHCKFGVDLAKQLIQSLHCVLPNCGSLRISFSRRTPEKVSHVILREFSGNPKAFIWNGEEPNPHMGHLAWANAFVITADSVSMLSEACSTGKPVYVIGMEQCTWKFTAFHKALQERGVVRLFSGKEDISESWSYPPLNDTAFAAAQVQEALAKRGWTLQNQ